MLYEQTRDHISKLSDQDLVEYAREDAEMYDRKQSLLLGWRWSGEV